MKYRVVQDYNSQYETPIILTRGDKVSVGERYLENLEWPGWIWCENERGLKGWVPERIIESNDNSGIVLEDYSALELTVKKGEIVDSVGAEGGWLWCRNSDGSEGWIPERNVKLYTGD
jgi:hypothetical protein